LLEKLGALAHRLGPLEVVLVDGSPWSRRDDLASAGATDAVYAFDPTSGAVRFGDGSHGCRPPDGARIVVAYRYGAGAAGHLPGGEVAAGLSSLRRVRYFAGQLLGPADFAADQEYHRAKQHLLNRHLHGWGVVDGLDVEVAGGEVVVSPGFALDRYGREIVVAGELRTAVDARADQTVLSVRYVEHETDPVPSSRGDDGSEHTRVVESCELLFDAEDRARVPLALLIRRDGRWHLDRKFRRRRVR
jgi:hypothetical protein